MTQGRTGHYRLTEDVVFEPQSPPSVELAAAGPFALGWFAAISIECRCVVLDLGGHRLSQGALHALRQRFFALIELASSPFVAGQGPGPFKQSAEPMEAAASFIVRNGVLGRSAHHGIHGNGNADFVLEDLIIEQFEVAAIHLNGPIRGLLRRVLARDSRTDVPVTGFFSHALNALPVLERAVAAHPEATWRGKSGAQIVKELQATVDVATAAVKAGNKVEGPYANPSGLPDGGLYGVVLNRSGVAVGDFPRDVGDEPASDLVIAGLTVDGLQSAPVEIVALADGTGAAAPGSGGGYGGGKGVVTGPAGDVIPIAALQVDGAYCPTALSEAQFFIAKHGVGRTERGNTNVPSAVLGWAEGGELAPDRHYRVSNGDSMFHVMKGHVYTRPGAPLPSLTAPRQKHRAAARRCHQP